MPAAAVIPALIAYIKVVAVKKLVVGFWCRTGGRLLSYCPSDAFLLWTASLLTEGRVDADRLL